MDAKTLREAVTKGDLETVKKIVEENPALVNTDDEYEWRPIFHAGLGRHYDIVKYLIDQGADLSAHNGYVMHFAGEVSNNKDVLSLLILHGGLDSHTEPAHDISRQFIHAVFLANGSRVKAMLQANPDLVHERYARGDIALHHAARNGDLEIVKILVEHGSDIDAISDNQHFPLYCAAGHGHVDTTQYLVEKGTALDTLIGGKETIGDWLKHYAENDKRFQGCLEIIEGAS